MKKTQEHQELSEEEARLNAQLFLAQEPANEGESRAQAEVVNILARLDDIKAEMEDMVRWQAQLSQWRRSGSGY